MLISRVWVESLLSGGNGASLDDEAFGEAMTSLGLEVDAIHRHGLGLEKVVVGRVDGVRPHPDADKLRLVDLFDGQQTLEVVCGAPNVPGPGGKVAFAPIGAELPNGMKLEARKVRGVLSHGMLCAEDELDLGHDDSGILVLPEDWVPGTLLIDLVPGAVDVVYELGVTPNRPDALGHIGVARDLAVKFGATLQLPERSTAHVPTDASMVTIEAPQRCGRYLGFGFEGARIGPSPLWLRVRLHRLGLRPINNVVDITNLVLMEWGQPLHAFDRDRLNEGRVVVRPAKPQEPLQTLDDQELELGEDDLVIADAKDPQALAGVMGGASSGVTEDSGRLLLEAAWFDPSGVRRTARRHQISSDSSHRFERGVDHGAGLQGAASRARALIEELCEAKCIAACEAEGHRPPIPEIVLRLERAKAVLGMEIPSDEALRVLRGLEVRVDDADPSAWRCRPPTHRPDLLREEDLIEELVRYHGLEHLPAVATPPSSAPASAVSPEELAEIRARLFQERLVDALRGLGLVEHISMAFANPEALEPFAGDVPLARAVRLANPLRVQASVLRTHMLPGLLDALAINLARHGRPIRLFEFGRVYAWPEHPEPASGPTAEIDEHLPTERHRAAILLCTPHGPHDGEELDGRALAGLMLGVVNRLGYRGRLVSAAEQTRPYLHPGVQAGLEVAGPQGWCEVGRFGEVHPDVLRGHDIEDGVRAYYGELRIEAMPDADVPHFGGIPRFPATSRDLSLDVPVSLPASSIVAALAQAEAEQPVDGDPPRLSPGDRGGEAIEVVEDYRGEGIESGRRALLFRLHYRAAHRSVTDDEVQARHDAIVQSARAALERSHAIAVRPR